MNETVIFPDESYKINGACMEVYKSLGNGFLEAVYQEAVEIELKKGRFLFDLNYHSTSFIMDYL